MNHPTHAPGRASRLSPRLPLWSAHPGFGVVALFAVAVLLIVLGEPQPSSRPSGTSVPVSGSPTVPAQFPATIAVTSSGGVVVRTGGANKTVALPRRAHARSVVTGGSLSVVLAVLDDRQRAYAIRRNLSVVDLGYADAVIPAGRSSAAVVVEAAAIDPGRLHAPSASPTAGDTSTASTSPSSDTTEPVDYVARRYNDQGAEVGSLQILPHGMRVGADTREGLVAWRPENVITDSGVTLEPTSATAALIRPDGSVRPLGAIDPLAVSGSDLLVWDLVRKQFGLMPLNFLNSTATSTASPSVSETASTPSTPSGSAGSSESRSAESPSAESPSATPTTVAGTRWFTQTRGLTVTGPASFAPDGSAFAVYAQVGSRRRLVVAAIPAEGAQATIEVLALTTTLTKPSTASSSVSPSASLSGGVGSSGVSSTSASVSPSAPTSSSPVIDPYGFPFEAPLSPVWWETEVVGLGNEGTVVGYQPGSGKATPLDIGLHHVIALAAAP